MQILPTLIALTLVFGVESADPQLAPPLAQQSDARNLAPEGDAALPAQSREVGGVDVNQPNIWQSLAETYRPDSQAQVRIERRVIIRISPRRPIDGGELLAGLPRETLPQEFLEKGMGKCIPIREIGGVQVQSGNRLLLFMRDRRIVRATLEKGCRARDFYSGFYVERGEDGLMCSGRDILQSRSGTKCELRKMHRLVPVKD